MKKLNMNKTTRQNYLTYGLVIVAFVIIQIFMGAMPRQLCRGMLVPICAYVIMAISLNLTVGVLGELSLGHAGFMSVGAFTGTTVAIMLQDVVPSGRSSPAHCRGRCRPFRRPGWIPHWHPCPASAG